VNTINHASVRPNKLLKTARVPNWVYIFPVIFVLGLLAFNIFQPIKVLPRLSLAPGFSFTNQAGQQLTSEDYRSKLVLYNFTYTHCGADCEEMVAEMQALRNRLNTEPDLDDLSFALVTISLDPERDTPAVLGEYANRFQLSQDNDISWDFIAGDPLRTKYVVGGGFSLYYEKETINTDSKADYRVKFDPRFVLVDGWGIIRAVYYTDTLDTERVMSDIGYLTGEVRNSKGIARLAYEGAHLFKCYPY
jgi:protein SCO1/2